MPVLAAVDSEVAVLPSLMNASGFFPDLNYSSGGDRSEWPASFHLQRCLMMSTAVRSPLSQWYGSSTVSAAAATCTAAWTAADPINSNWWWMQLGVPMLISKCLLLVPNASTTAAANAVIFPRISLADAVGFQGANRQWATTINVLIGLLNSNTTHITASYALMAEGLLTVPGDAPPTDGIQADASFHQHGPLAQFSFAYGAHMAANALTAAAMAAGTGWTLTGSAGWADLVGYVTGGARWVSTGSSWHAGAAGRHIAYYARKDAYGVANGHYHYFAAYAAFPLAFPSFAAPLPSALSVLYWPLLSRFAGQPGGEALLSFYQQIAANNGSGGVTGHKRFWKSDYAVHARSYPSRSFSLHTMSNRTLNTECVNDENFRGRPLADGMLLSYAVGNEYDGLYPVWRWTLLPGVTAVQAGGDYTCDNAQITDAPERLSFTGGASDGWIGLACMDVNRSDSGHTVQARKAWFFFEEGAVALGAGLASDGGVAVTTSLEQRNLDPSSPVLLQSTAPGAAPVTIQRGTAINTTDVAWTWHADTLYLQLPQPGLPYPPLQAPGYVSTQAMLQGGSWADIVDGVNNTTPLLLPTFLHYIHHGDVTAASPEWQRSYAYAVLGGVPQTAAAGAAAAFNASVTIATNTVSQQAVCKAPLNATISWALQAVFWPPEQVAAPAATGQVVTAPGCANVTVTVTRPCLIMLAFTPGSLTVTLSDPMTEAGAAAVDVGVTGLAFNSVSGPGCSASHGQQQLSVTVPLPQGALKGSATSVTCTIS